MVSDIRDWARDCNYDYEAMAEYVNTHGLEICNGCKYEIYIPAKITADPYDSHPEDSDCRLKRCPIEIAAEKGGKALEEMLDECCKDYDSE